MADKRLRLVHASDFHLERPLGGVTEVPDHLREAFLEAPYLAAQQVIETALAEEADFLLLSGDVVDVRCAGPLAIVFLAEQFERLAARNIAVYWTGGSVDFSEGWEPHRSFPDNVHIFPTGHVRNGHVKKLIHCRDEEPVAQVLGIGCVGKGRLELDDFQHDTAGLFTVGVAYGSVSPLSLSKSGALSKVGVDYLALGGQHLRQTISEPPNAAHYSGSPQGRCPQESGWHGCTLVDFDHHGEAQLRFVSTDVVRWLDERVEIDGGTSPDQIESILHERTRRQLERSAGVDLLISWTIEGPESCRQSLWMDGLAERLIVGLREQFGHVSPAAWSVSLAAKPSASPPRQWYDQDTILGDFLRQVRSYQADGDMVLDLDRFLPENSCADELASQVSLGVGEKNKNRERVLHLVTLMGIDLVGESVGGHDLRQGSTQE